jgi:tRNA(adenine34) deaminase
VPAGAARAQPGAALRPFMDLAFEMRQRAVAAGDQPYGAVVVCAGTVLAAAPSRVVSARNPDAHAEREALRLALERQGGGRLDGALLVSSSRPCGACETAAYRAGIARMIHGHDLTDAGPPRG